MLLQTQVQCLFMQAPYNKRSQLPISPSHNTILRQAIYFVKFRPRTNNLESFRYKQHKTDFEVIPTDRPILLPCKQKGCKCVSYNYVPMNGSQPIRCTCKHTSEEHFEFEPFICKRSKTVLVLFNLYKTS